MCAIVLLLSYTKLLKHVLFIFLQPIVEDHTVQAASQGEANHQVNDEANPPSN